MSRALHRLVGIAVATVVALGLVAPTGAQAVVKPLPVVQVPVPTVPAPPVPGQDWSISGRMGKVGTKVKLQRKVGPAWTTVARQKAERGGRYTFFVRAGTVREQYRTMAKFRGKLRISVPARMVPLTGRRLWQYDDTCLHGPEQDAQIACFNRDTAIIELGKVTARDFHAAWLARSSSAMRALAMSDDVVSTALEQVVTSSPPRCEVPNTSGFGCSVDSVSGGALRINVQVASFEKGQLPVWRVSSVYVPAPARP